jgi:hypothetical protein
VGYINSFAVSLFVLLFLQVHSAISLIHLISVAFILLASLALMVQFSLPYNRSGSASLYHNFILVFLKLFVV